MLHAKYLNSKDKPSLKDWKRRRSQRNVMKGHWYVLFLSYLPLTVLYCTLQAKKRGLSQWKTVDVTKDNCLANFTKGLSPSAVYLHCGQQQDDLSQITECSLLRLHFHLTHWQTRKSLPWGTTMSLWAEDRRSLKRNKNDKKASIFFFITRHATNLLIYNLTFDQDLLHFRGF